jgi:hypothetical protein
MKPATRLKQELAEFVSDLKGRGLSQAQAMRDADLPSETFKNIRKGHLPSRPEVRAKLAKMLGYESADALFSSPPRNPDRGQVNGSLGKMNDDKDVEEPTMSPEITNAMQRLSGLSVKDQALVLGLIDRLDMTSGARGEPARRPPQTAGK